MKQATRQKLIETGARIMHHKGYNYTGIQEVLRAAAVPKGSFYFYFRNKEDFGMEVVDHYTARYKDRVTPLLDDKSMPPLKRIAAVLDMFIDLYAGTDFTLGCPIGNLSQEMGDLSPAFRSKLQQSVREMSTLYEQVLQEAKQTGDMQLLLDPGELADFILVGWQGALVRMKIEKSPKPLENHKNIVMKILEAALPYY